MTKEELLQDERIFSAANGDVSYIPLHSLDKFFSQNVVIPKGQHRHPYADVLHEWIEGTTKCLEVLFREMDDEGYTGVDEWKRCNAIPTILPLTLQYRIKPKGPVYEWQWVYGLRGLDSRAAHVSPHLTKEEFIKYLNDRNSAYTSGYYFYHVIEETKRERKWVDVL